MKSKTKEIKYTKYDFNKRRHNCDLACFNEGKIYACDGEGHGAGENSGEPCTYNNCPRIELFKSEKKAGM